MSERNGKIFPRNLTARAHHMVAGNPVTTRPEDAASNCYPGLELDVRNFDRRFFPGLVFEFIARNDISSPYTEPMHYGARLAYLDHLEDPELAKPEAKPLLARLQGRDGARLSDGEWYLEWIEQGGKKIYMRRRNDSGQPLPLDGLFVWRFVRSIVPGELTIGLNRRKDGEEIALAGFRRRYTDEHTGVLSLAYQPGELGQSLCSPWQHDFRDCACSYWASSRPDVVLGEVRPGEKTADPMQATLLLDWMRDRSRAGVASAQDTFSKNRPFQYDHYQINHAWQDLAVVVRNTEVGAFYAPGPEHHAAPFASPQELAEELRVLAGLELALNLEYLYAYYSLRGVEEVEGEELKKAVAFVRNDLLLIAMSEMLHLRWANQLLWMLYEHGLIEQRYEPVLTPARQIPLGAPPRIAWRERALRRFDSQTRKDFIAGELPSGELEKTYARVVVTLRDPRYPAHLVEVARRTVADSIGHYNRFRVMDAVLRAYSNEDAYLRQIEKGTPEQCRDALDLLSKVVDSLKDGYSKLGERHVNSGGQRVAVARQTMHELDAAAEQLAEQGIGVPFFHRWEAEAGRIQP
ncbi:hypothetical protein BE21_35960 [Sorangium cellulosum]|uniref:Iminophenyl-pyruvate dimer synthase domain-containing protein n=1 Tax=Sorangium cellulosum TaxID=56 RepID=A0A150TP63_SORCE|nr:hypothetical protein BE21_35960 [Sorangium cellulosum]